MFSGWNRFDRDPTPATCGTLPAPECILNELPADGWPSPTSPQCGLEKHEKHCYSLEIGAERHHTLNRLWNLPRR